MKGLGVLIFATVAVLAVNLSATITGVGTWILSRPTAWIATVAIFAVLLAYVGRAQKGRLDGVFIDDRNRISLARFQLVLWTVLLVSALMSAGLFNVALIDPAPLEIKVPAEVWALLGIGAFSFVTSPVLVESRKKDPTPDPDLVNKVEAKVSAEDELTKGKKIEGLDNNVPSKFDEAEARWMDIVRGDTTAGYAHIDISKVQQLAFSILLVTIYGAALYNMMTKSTVAIKDFPAVDQGLVALLGLSSAAYLAYKKTAT